MSKKGSPGHPMSNAQRKASINNWKLVQINGACATMRSVLPAYSKTVDEFQALALVQLGYTVLLYAEPNPLPSCPNGLAGFVYGSPLFRTGEHILTTTVQKLFRTRSGNYRARTKHNLYYILQPTPEFYEWVETSGIKEYKA